MALVKKSKVKSMFTKEDAENFAKEYNDISKKMKELDAKKKDLSEKLKKCAELLGVEDDKGSSYIDGADFIIGKVARRSVKINQAEGVDFLKVAGLKECIKRQVIQTVDESKVEKAVEEGKLTEEDVKSFTSVSTSYSVSVKPKEEMPEVEVSSVARKK